MSQIRDRKVALKPAEPIAASAEPPAVEEGLAASLALIRKGGVALKPTAVGAKPSPKAPLVREPSGSIASALRRRLEERKHALDGAAPGAAVEEEEADEWE